MTGVYESVRTVFTTLALTWCTNFLDHIKPIYRAGNWSFRADRKAIWKAFSDHFRSLPESNFFYLFIYRMRQFFSCLEKETSTKQSFFFKKASEAKPLSNWNSKWIYMKYSMWDRNPIQRSLPSRVLAKKDHPI